MPNPPSGEQEQHAENMRLLALIREDRAWALSRVQAAAQAESQVAALQSDLRIAREALEEIAEAVPEYAMRDVAKAALQQLEAGQEQEGDELLR